MINKFRQFADDRGVLTVFDKMDLPFDAKRIFFVSDVPLETSRGEHAHYECDQFIILITGSLSVTLHKKSGEVSQVSLQKPFDSFLIPKMHFASQVSKSSNTTYLVLASLPYDKDDYIESYQKWVDL